ncbi:MAG TPA: RsmD family RNA methyltransferase [Flavobacteriaceae bacterium]|nr:RsmD family RNA methyltransferase [Flavobacteriaceae bacterium]
MRIISGTFKGRKIEPPKQLPVRPTTDMAKEALFNILNNSYNLSEVSVLDLYAGTGSISYEFASRGTKHITSVDSNYLCAKFIRQTAEKINLPIQVVKADVFKYLNHLNTKYDIIFADPPYQYSIENYTTLVSTIFNNNLLSEYGILILEHEKQKDLSSIDYFAEARNYGGCVFSFFEKPQAS